MAAPQTHRRSRPTAGEQYTVSHDVGTLILSDHVLQFGFHEDAIFLHFHMKEGNLHATHKDLIKHPPIDIIRLNTEDVQLLLEKIVWADSSRENKYNAQGF